MTADGWIFCAVCALTSALAIGSLIAMLFYVYAEKREERERIAARMPHPAPKPDAAKECGVVKPKFDEKSPLFRKIEIRAEAKGQPRRMGKHKVRIYLYDVPEPLLFHDLAELYRFAEVRKCDFSPSRKMDEDDRLAFIAARIVFFYRGRGLTVRAVSLYRKKRWHAFEYDEKGYRK